MIKVCSAWGRKRILNLCSLTPEETIATGLLLYSALIVFLKTTCIQFSHSWTWKLVTSRKTILFWCLWTSNRCIHIKKKCVGPHLPPLLCSLSMDNYFHIFDLNPILCPARHADLLCVHTNIGCVCILILYCRDWALDIIYLAVSTFFKSCQTLGSTFFSPTCCLVFCRKDLLHFAYLTLGT